MRVALILSFLLIGSGAGLIVRGLLRATPLQAMLATALAGGILVAKTAKRDEGLHLVALISSLVAAITLVQLRNASSLLYLLSTKPDACTRSPLLSTMLEGLDLESFYSPQVLILVAASVALSLGLLLLHSSLASITSPLWLGLEKLAFPSIRAAARRPRPLYAGIGACVGVLASAVDYLVLQYNSFLVLVAASSTIGTSLTLSVHLPVAVLINAALPEGLATSIMLGVQLGVVASMLVITLLLYYRRAAREYANPLLSIASLSLSILTLVAYFTTLLGPTLTAFKLVAMTLLVASLVHFLALRFEGDMCFPLTSVASYVPLTAWVLVHSLTPLLELDSRLSNLLLHPFYHLVLAILTLWSFRVVPHSFRGASVTVVAAAGLTAPPLLAVLRGLIDPNRWKPVYQVFSTETIAMLESPTPHPLNVWVLLAVAAVVLAVQLLAYYLPPKKPRLRLLSLAFNPGGLIVAFTYAALPSVNPAIWPFLLVLSIARYILLRRRDSRLAELSSTALVSYTPISLTYALLKSYGVLA